MIYGDYMKVHVLVSDLSKAEDTNNDRYKILGVYFKKLDAHRRAIKQGLNEQHTRILSFTVKGDPILMIDALAEGL